MFVTGRILNVLFRFPSFTFVSFIITMLFRLLTQPIRQQVRQQAKRVPTLSCSYTTTTKNATTNTFSSGSSASQFADSVSKKFIGKGLTYLCTCTCYLTTSLSLSLHLLRLRFDIGQAKNGQVGRRINNPSKFLVVDNLPLTATTEDVKKLAREAFTQGDKCMNESKYARTELL